MCQLNINKTKNKKTKKNSRKKERIIFKFDYKLFFFAWQLISKYENLSNIKLLTHTWGKRVCT